MALRATGEFEGGNARVERIVESESGSVVYFAAQHKKGGPQALWFYLRVEGVTAPALRCVLTNPSQILGGAGSWRHNWPVCRIGDGPWQRIRQVEDRVNEHLVNEVLLTIPVPIGEHSVEVAACYPYLMRDLKSTLTADRAQFTWTEATIGYSHEGRPIIRVYNSLGDEVRSKPGVFFIARQHSGETPGSWLLDGILRFLASPEGERISQEMCVWAVPIADPDGVACGSYGKDQFPWDLNRAWDRPLRPETHAIQSDLVRWSRRCRPHMVVDLHAPGYSERAFYFWAPSHPASIAQVTHRVANEFHQRVPKHLRGSEPAFRRWGTTNTSVQQGTSCIGFGIEKLGIPTATLEMSYHGPDNQSVYTQDDYRLLGRILIETLYHTLN